MNIKIRVFSNLAAIAGLFFASVAAEAGVVRRPGNPTVVAPAAPGNTFLISDSIGVGTTLPSVLPDYDFNIGHAPGIEVDHAGVTVCDITAFVDCWGEYLPDETATFGGGIWGGHPTALLEFTLNIKDGDGTILYAFNQNSPEATVLGFYPTASTPGNPCVDVFLYNGDIGCQYFEVSLVLPLALVIEEWYYAQWEASYVAPNGMHFALNNQHGDGHPIETVTDRLSSFSDTFRFKRIAPVDEPSTLALIMLGGVLLGSRLRKRRRSLQEAGSKS